MRRDNHKLGNSYIIYKTEEVSLTHLFCFYVWSIVYLNQLTNLSLA